MKKLHVFLAIVATSLIVGCVGPSIDRGYIPNVDDPIRPPNLTNEFVEAEATTDISD